jgi:TonB-linked SusC/RagA family outer membrane protein
MKDCLPHCKELSFRRRLFYQIAPFFCIIFFSFFTADVLAQTTPITGRVTAGDTALTGATVQVKGSTTATQTDDDGRFTISAAPTATLVISSIGYTTQEIKVNNRSTLTIQLATAGQQLNDVVVVGYGTQRRATVSGAVSSIKSDDLTRTTSTTTSGAMVGKIQGITARQTDARPGGITNIQIRNMGAPLYVIDGVPADAGQFNQMGIDDIENISVLKDASAAIYGLRAANGVILVTTKKGRAGGKTQINVNGYRGYQNFTRLPKPPDASTYLRGLAWSNQNLGLPNPVTLTPAEIAKWDAGTEKGYQSFDYYRYVMRPNVPQTYLNANASGGSANSKFYLSLSHTDQEALIKDFSFGRTNIQANLEAGLAKGLKVGAQIFGRYEKRRQTGVPGLDDYFNPFLSVYTMWPTERPYANDNPNFVNGDVHNINVNPATYESDVTGYSRDDWRAMKGIFTAQYDLPFGLSLKGTYQYNYTTRFWEEFEYTYVTYTYDAANDAYNIKPGAGNQNPWRRKTRQNIENNFGQLQLNYSKTLGEHSISAVAAYERSQEINDLFEVGALPQNNTVSIIPFTDMNRAVDQYNEEARAGYIGRINYNFKQRYLVEALARYDGSYLYRKDNRWGFFPGVSVGWRMLEEPFMQNSFGEAFNELKLRASYGETGSEIGAGPFGYLVGYNYLSGDAVFNGVRVTGASPRGLPITSLSWVTNVSKNIGIDFAFLRNKFSGSVDVFERRRTGLPASQSDIVLPLEVGYSFPNQNLNSDAIRGIEGILTYQTSTGAGLHYSISGNATLARNRSLFIYNPRFGNSWDEYRNSSVDRWSSVNFGYHIVGQFQSMEQIANHPIDNDGQGNRTQLPGDLIYDDVNKDKVINGLDERPIGYAEGAQPYLSFGLNTQADWKGFSLAIDFAGANMQTYRREFEAQIPFQNNGGGVAYLISDAWRRTDPFDANSAWIPGTFPAVRKDQGGHNNYNKRNDFWITNVSYFRMRNLQLGYELPKNFLNRFGIRGIRVYVNGTNLFSIDNMKKFQIDPEIASTNALAYPQQRIYTFGFNVNL